MRLFLAGCLVLLLVLSLTLWMRLRRPPQQATRKRVREPRQQRFNESLDADVVLGLKQPMAVENDNEPSSVEQAQAMPASEPVKMSLDYVLLHVMSFDDKNYGGYELLQALLANGLRYEAKDRLFHAYAEAGEKTIFSLASVNKPGTFDLPMMSQFYCPGLTLFMVLEDTDCPEQVFERMLETANQLAEDLGGEVWGEDRQTLTTDKLYQLRQQLKQHVPV